MEISVIVPVHNAEKYLKRCVDSILCQTLADFELILINDGSSDGSRKMCGEYAERDNRVRVINKDKSEGAGPARNSGIDASGGKYIMFLDADDYIEANMLERLTSVQQQCGCDLVICSYSCFADGVDNYTETNDYADEYLDDRDKTRRFFANTFPDGKAGYLWNKLYLADIIKDNNLRFPDMRRLQDGVFNIAYFNCISTCRIISDSLYHYMLNPQTGLFKKCPPDYFELISRFSGDFLDTAGKWGYNNEQCQKNISAFFLGEVGNCLENATSENWNMDKKSRYEYFEKLRQNEFLRDCLTKPAAIGKYRKLLLALLKSGHFALLSAVIGIKTGIKKNFKHFFYALKGVENK